MFGRKKKKTEELEQHIDDSKQDEKDKKDDFLDFSYLLNEFDGMQKREQIKEKVKNDLYDKGIAARYIPYIITENLFFESDKQELLKQFLNASYENGEEARAYILCSVDFESEEELIIKERLIKTLHNPKYVYIVLVDAKLTKKERNYLERILKKSESIQYKFYYEYLKGNEELIDLFKENDLRAYVENSKIFKDSKIKSDFFVKLGDLRIFNKDFEVSEVVVGQNKSYDEEKKWQYIKTKHVSKYAYDYRRFK